MGRAKFGKRKTPISWTEMGVINGGQTLGPTKIKDFRFIDGFWTLSKRLRKETTF